MEIESNMEAIIPTMLCGGVSCLRNVYACLADNKSRELLNDLNSYLHDFQPTFKHMEKRESELAFKAFHLGREAQRELFNADSKLNISANMTIQFVDECQNLLQEIPNNPNKKEEFYKYIEKQMKSLVDESEKDLNNAINQYEEINGKLNQICNNVMEFHFKLDKVMVDLKKKEKDAVKLSKRNLFDYLRMEDKKQEKAVASEFAFHVDNTKKTQEKTDQIYKKLEDMKQTIEKAQRELDEWIAIVKFNKASYSKGNHVAELYEISPAALKQEFVKLQNVCIEYLNCPKHEMIDKITEDTENC